MLITWNLLKLFLHYCKFCPSVSIQSPVCGTSRRRLLRHTYTYKIRIRTMNIIITTIIPVIAPPSRDLKDMWIKNLCPEDEYRTCFLLAWNLTPSDLTYSMIWNMIICVWSIIFRALQFIRSVGSCIKLKIKWKIIIYLYLTTLFSSLSVPEIGSYTFKVPKFKLILVTSNNRIYQSRFWTQKRFLTRQNITLHDTGSFLLVRFRWYEPQSLW
jgi:hypothetical protein